MILAGVALAGLAILGGVLVWLSTRGGSDSKALAETMREAGCSFRTMPEEGRTHVRDGTKVAYKSKPVPTSGRHYDRPAIWNSYDVPVEQERLVHNLEHGGVVIQYGDGVPAETRNQLQEFYLDDANGLVLAPLPRLGDKITLAAWTKVAVCTQFDEDAFGKFRDELRYKGPERFAPEFLAPGT